MYFDLHGLRQLPAPSPRPLADPSVGPPGAGERDFSTGFAMDSAGDPRLRAVVARPIWFGRQGDPSPLLYHYASYDLSVGALGAGDAEASAGVLRALVDDWRRLSGPPAGEPPRDQFTMRCILGILRESGLGWSFANAFEGSIVQPGETPPLPWALAALTRAWTRARTVYRNTSVRSARLWVAEGLPVGRLAPQHVSTLDALVDALAAAASPRPRA